MDGHGVVGGVVDGEADEEGQGAVDEEVAVCGEAAGPALGSRWGRGICR